MISNIMSKRHGILWKTIQLFLKREKTGNMTEFKLTNFRRLSFGNDIAKCNTYIIATSVLDFKQLYIFYKFYPKNRYIYLTELYIWYRYLPAQDKYSYTLPRLCVLFFAGS